MATINSKKNNIHKRPKKQMPNKAVNTVKPETLFAKIKKTKPETTCSRICPARILAKSRSDKLTTLNIYDINSTKIKNGTNKYGIPFGNIILKKTRPFFQKPIVITESHMKSAKENVLVKWLVIDGENGSIPIKFEIKTAKNTYNKNGK